MKTLGNKTALLIIFSCVVLHRLIIFLTHYDLFIQQVEFNQSFLGLQYLAVITLEQHLLQGLWQLQHSPPLPNLVIGIGIKAFGFPYGLACYLVLLQGLVSCLTTILVFLCLDKLNINKILALVLSLAFAFSTDLLLMEYSVLGQAIHESLTMLLVTLFVYCLLAKKNKMLILAGICVGLLALNRSYFFLFPIVAVCALLIQQVSLKKVALFIIPVMLLQGSWATKNLLVHQHATLQASTISGFNLENALASTGYYDEFSDYVKENDEHCPPWLQTATEEQGVVFLWLGKIFPYMPVEQLKAEMEKIELLGGDRQNFMNSDIVREISDCYRHAWFGFAASNPGIITDAFRQSYIRFWQPFRSYTRSYVAFFYPRKLHSFLGDKGKHEMSDAESVNDIFIMQAALAKTPDAAQPIDKTEKITANTYTLGAINLLLLYLNFFAIHCLLPAALLYCFIKKQYSALRLLLTLTAVYSFTAILSSLGENGENNRFRLAVEPVIWILSSYLYFQIYRLLEKKFTASAEALERATNNAEPAVHATPQQGDR